MNNNYLKLESIRIFEDKIKAKLVLGKTVSQSFFDHGSLVVKNFDYRGRKVYDT